eukprot:1282846-Pleurochrysis_carterae.AAC.1
MPVSAWAAAAAVSAAAMMATAATMVLSSRAWRRSTHFSPRRDCSRSTCRTRSVKRRAPRAYGRTAPRRCSRRAASIRRSRLRTTWLRLRRCASRSRTWRRCAGGWTLRARGGGA